MLHLQPIDSKTRLTEEQVWKKFAEMHPRILGSLLDAVVEAMRNQNVVLERMPRMADFALWVTKAKSAFGWGERTFLLAFEENRMASQQAALEVDPIAVPLIKLVKKRKHLVVTATELLAELNNVESGLKFCKDWPKSPNALKTRITRLQPLFDQEGISVCHSRTPIARQMEFSVIEDDDEPPLMNFLEEDE